jgi:hypothetical protein
MRIIPRPALGRALSSPPVRPSGSWVAPSPARARVALCGVPAALALCLVFCWAAADVSAPARIDPEYLVRRNLLRDRLAEHPDARLVVVLGSSRVGMGFAPETVPPAPTDRPTIWFNASHVGAGPLFNLVVLNRLLAEGIRPAAAVIEVMPAFFARENPRFVGPYLSARELAFASDYLPAGRLGWQCVRRRYTRPWSLKQLADPESATAPLLPLGGRAHLEEEITPEDRAARVAGQEQMHGPAARELEVTPGADRALRDALRACRERGIVPVLLLAPESTAFRRWYDPDRLRHFEEYLAAVSRENGANLIDARGWLADDAFTDGHHPLRRGAAAFSERLISTVAGSPG